MFWNRIGRGRRKQVVVEADSQIEEAVQAAASQRLGRLVSRQREGVAQSASAENDATAKIPAQFGDCAFLRLGVPMAATAADIHHAVDDLSFAENIDPQALSQAQAELLSPRDRLTHELAWLPGCDAEFQRRAVAALTAGDCDAIDALRFATSGLARINLGCALVAACPQDERALANLLVDLPRWQVHESHALVDEARLTAGLRPVESEHFDEAAADRRDAIAALLAETAAATREGRQGLANAIAANSDTVRTAANPALEAVIAAYARVVDPRLQNMQTRIAEAIAALKENPRQPARLTVIISTLDLWSQFRLPLQRLEQARGLDDPLSARLFGDLRDLGIGLANEHQLHAETLRLARTLKQAFASVPGLQPMLERDLPMIIGNVLADHMLDLAKETLQNLGKFCTELRNCGFAPDAGPRATRLIDCFEQWNEAQPAAEQPFAVLREIAIAINNKQMAPSLAMQIIEWLLEQKPPQTIAARLTHDMCQLRQNLNRKK